MHYYKRYAVHFKQFKKYYLKKYFKINILAPQVFSILFGMMKPFMSGHTLNKIQIFPEKKEQWQPVILDLVDPEQIREQFGGTKL